MLSEFKGLRIMGLSNSGVFLPEKECVNGMQFNLAVRPALEFHDRERQTSTPEDCELSPKHLVQEQDQESDKDKEQCNVSEPAPLLELKIPSYNMEAEKDDEPNDGFKTPTSSDHKIPAVLKCPPAPRKLKSIPSRKRKASASPIILDLSKEIIGSLFPTLPLEDRGGKIKKVKQTNDTQCG